MPVFTMTQVINRPVAEVFNTVIHLEDFPKWSPQNPSAKRVSDGEIGEGSRFLMEIKGFGMVPQVLREFETNRRVRVVPDLKTLSGGHRWTFTPESGNRTRIDHELEMTPKGIYKLMLPMFLFVGRRTVRITAEALRAYLEKEPSTIQRVNPRVTPG
jgi:uncharacterized protein YndB with AHSA1/START domain